MRAVDCAASFAFISLKCDPQPKYCQKTESRYKDGDNQKQDGIAGFDHRHDTDDPPKTERQKVRRYPLEQAITGGVGCWVWAEECQDDAYSRQQDKDGCPAKRVSYCAQNGVGNVCLVTHLVCERCPSRAAR